METITGKVTIKSEHSNETMNVNINIEQNKIWYIENTPQKTTAIFNTDTNTLERDNQELYLKYTFEENQETLDNILHIKSLNKTTNINISTKTILKKKNLIKIVYTIENVDFTYILELNK